MYNQRPSKSSEQVLYRPGAPICSFPSSTLFQNSRIHEPGYTWHCEVHAGIGKPRKIPFSWQLRNKQIRYEHRNERLYQQSPWYWVPATHQSLHPQNLRNCRQRLLLPCFRIPSLHLLQPAGHFASSLEHCYLAWWRYCPSSWSPILWKPDRWVARPSQHRTVVQKSLTVPTCCLEGAPLASQRRKSEQEKHKALLLPLWSECGKKWTPDDDV